MDYPFTIKDLSTRVKKSEQSLYSLIKKNQEFIKQNSHRQGRFIKYNQAVLDWFVSYYGGAAPEDPETQPPQDTPEMAPEGRQDASSEPAEDLSCQRLQAKIEALEAENKELRERLATITEEKKVLHENLGLTLLMLREERETTKRLLPPPRKTFAEKVRSIFSKGNSKNEEDTSKPSP